MKDKLLESLYNEFGREKVHIVRRTLTAQNGRSPTYLELYSALALANGWQTPPLIDTCR